MIWHTPSYGYSLLQDPQIPSLNKLPYHAPCIPYPTAEEALTLRYNDSPYYELLNGDWKFCYYECISDIPEAVVREDYDDSTWDSIPVPSNWQLHGYGRPKYINQRYTHEKDSMKLHPPLIDDSLNAAGIYHRSFELPSAFQERRTILSIEGVESAVMIYINGTLAGYSANGRSAADFDFCIPALYVCK